MPSNQHEISTQCNLRCPQKLEEDYAPDAANGVPRDKFNSQQNVLILPLVSLCLPEAI